MKLKFTGHDTFPLRYGWLYKAVNHIKNNGLLLISDADKTAATISSLGVGKNMVNAIKYWSESAQLTVSSRGGDKVARTGEIVQSITEIGSFLFDENKGYDPFLEDLGSVWLIHFLLNFDDSALTAYRYFFNYSSSSYFEKTKLIADLAEKAIGLTGQNSIKAATIKKDVDCFLATYAVRPKVVGAKNGKVVDEDHFASPLTELGLIRDAGRGYYQCDLTDRPSLPLDIFLYAVARYFQFCHLESTVSTVSFEDLLAKPLSPGRIFKLSEAGLGRLLDEAVVRFKGQIAWIDSLGLKQVAIDSQLMESPFELLVDYYERQV